MSRTLIKTVVMLLMLSVLVPPPATPAPAAPAAAAHVDEARVQRFLELWVPRVQDRAWFESYVESGTLPDEIRAEGFHGLDDATEEQLSGRLLDALIQRDPSRYATVTPAQIETQRRMLRSMVFEQAADLRPAAENAPEVETSQMDGPTPLQQRLEAGLHEAKQPVAREVRVPGHLPHPAVREVDPVDVLGADRVEKLPAPELPVPDVGALVGAGNWKACSERASGTAACSDDLPLGAPASVDVDGDGVLDVTMQLAPSVNPSAVGLTFGLSAVRLSAGALPAHVFAVFTLGEREARLGFDGRRDTLALRTEGTYTVQPEALTGDGAFSVGLTHLEPGSSSGVTGRLGTLDAAIGFTPVPQSLTASVSSTELVDATTTKVVLDTSQPSTIDATARSTAGNVIKTVQAAIEPLPSHVEVSFTDDGATGRKSASYRAAQPIDRISASFAQSSGGIEFVRTELLGVPTSVDVVLDMAAQTIDWTSSAPVASFTATGAILAAGRTWEAALGLSQIPARWQASFAEGRPSFRGVSGPIGQLTAAITNHGAVETLPGNHASVRFVKSSGDLDASLRMSDISSVSFADTPDGFTGDLRMGGGAPFTLKAALTTATRSIALNATLSPLPSSIQLTQSGDSITYQADRNFDLNASASILTGSALVFLPRPPVVHGLSVRSGLGCDLRGACMSYLLSNLFLRGFPRRIDIDPTPADPATGKLVTVSGFNPPAGFDHLTLDALVSGATVFLFQEKIPSNLTFSVGPINSTTLPDGSKQTHLAYTASAGLGRLTAFVERGALKALVVVSNIPSATDVTVTMGSPTSTVRVTTSQPIAEIFAFVGLAGRQFSASVHLGDIPTSVALTFGRITTVVGNEEATVPGLTYTASDTGLDLEASVTAELFNGDLQAQVTLGVVGLGRSVRAALEPGKKLRITSTPNTGLIEIHTFGSYRFIKDFSGCKGHCSFPEASLRFDGHVYLQPLTVNDLMVKIINVSDALITLGLTSAIEGDYGMFEFGWRTIRLNLDLKVHVEVCTPFGCPDLINRTVQNTFDLTVKFHVAANEFGTWKSFVCDLDIKPRPVSVSTNGFRVFAFQAFGGAWLVTPNPIIPGLLPSGFPNEVPEALAGIVSPKGGGFDVDC